METGIEIISEERQIKQIEKHGFTAKHHAEHPEWYSEGQLLFAAHHLLSTYESRFHYIPKNWNPKWWDKLLNKPYERRMAIAGAFIASEFDRRNYLKNQSK